MRLSIRAICTLLTVAFVPALAAAGAEEGKSKWVPFSGSFWPRSQGGLSGPARAYDRLTGHRAAAWEIKNHSSRGVQKWEGFCHAWSASTVLEDEPTKPRRVNINGKTATLSVGEQKGMLALCHDADVADFFGIRYSGKQGDDYQDVYPDVLWKNLKMYIKEQGVPVILDTDADVQVWNFPVYYYRVDYQPMGGDRYNCQMVIYYADDGVKPDYIGTKVRKNTYTFTCRMKNGSVIAGSGRWTGRSYKDHPDFGWYPKVVRPSNPEIKYGEVCKLLGINKDIEVPDNDPAPIRDPDNPPQPQGTSAPPPVNGRVTISPNELLTMVTNQTSDFDFQITVNGLQREFNAGDEFKVEGSSQKAGFLYLFDVQPDGEVKLIFPIGKQDNKIGANDKFTIGSLGAPKGSDPRAKIKFTCNAAMGQHVIKAVLVTQPLLLTALDEGGGVKSVDDENGEGPVKVEEPPQVLDFFYTETQMNELKKTVKAVLIDKKKSPTPEEVENDAGHKAHKLAGEFAQGETAFYVGKEKP